MKKNKKPDLSNCLYLFYKHAQDVGLSTSAGLFLLSE
jgi:hypothetical protein